MFWQSLFLKLTGRMGRKICATTQHGMEDVAHLVDKSWFSAAPDLKMLYPTCLAALFCVIQEMHRSSSLKCASLFKEYGQLAFEITTVATKVLGDS